MKSEIRLAVLGDPVGHSLSPAMHIAALRECGIDGSYDKVHVKAGDLSATVERLGREGLTGFNVTVPHKERVVGMLTHVDPAAERIGAVNTVVVRPAGLYGYNTDATGFARVVKDSQVRGSVALVLGAGGAARACVDTLTGLGWSVVVAARRPEQARRAFGGDVGLVNLSDDRHLQARLNASKLLVNATSAGMNQSTVTPLPEGVDIPQNLTVIDLVYAPLDTKLLRVARYAGCRAVDGLALLASQAADSFALWTAQRISDAFFRQAAEAALGASQESNEHGRSASAQQPTARSETMPA